MWRRHRDDYDGRSERDFRPRDDRYRADRSNWERRPWGERMPDRADAGSELYRRLYDDRDRMSAPFGAGRERYERDDDRDRWERYTGERYRGDYGYEPDPRYRRDFTGDYGDYDRGGPYDRHYRRDPLDLDFRPGQSFDANPRYEYGREYYGRDYDRYGVRRHAPRNEGEYAYDPDWDRGGRWRR